MAEYNDVIKQFKRMCRYYNGVKEGCPLYCKGHGCNISHCRLLAFEDKKFQNVVMAWAAEHPEPVYPTWIDVMKMYGVTDETGYCYLDSAYKPIPADIAVKLGLQPKEV